MPLNIPDSPAYGAMAAGDVASMLDPARYGTRSSAFDEIIAAAESHYWNPDDPRYLDYGKAFDLAEQPLLPPAFTPELLTAAADRLDAGRRIAFANELARFHLSQLLHGELAGVSLCGNLCMVFRDPGAQEYAANQGREEARHVRAVSRYFAARWGSPLPAGRTLARLVGEVIGGSEVYKKIVGMQIMIEGLALGIFSQMQAATADPVLARILQLMMTDEAYHHRFGQVWGQETVPQLNEAEHQQVENWSAACFLSVVQALFGTAEKAELYQRFGLDPKWMAGAMAEAFARPAVRREVGTARQLRVLLKTLVQTGIMTARTRPIYAAWFDLSALADDVSHPEDIVAEGTTAELREINRGLRARLPRTPK